MWLHAEAEVVDTIHLTPVEAALQIARAVKAGLHLLMSIISSTRSVQAGRSWPWRWVRISAKPRASSWVLCRAGLPAGVQTSPPAPEAGAVGTQQTGQVCQVGTRERV